MTPQACPADEQLAAFVDGRLPPGERGVVVQHVAGCGACQETVAGAAEFAEVAQLQRPGFRIQARILLAVAAALALALLVYWRGDRHAAPGSAAGALLARHTPHQLGAHVWRAKPIGLGFAPSGTPSGRALMWGVALTDLEIVLAAADREPLAARLSDLSQLVEAWPEAAAHYRTLLRRLEQGRLPELASLEPPPGAAVRGVSEGRWLEAGRLAALAGDTAFLSDRDVRSRLREVATVLEDPAALRLLAEAEAALDSRPADPARAASLLADLLRTL